MFEELLDTFENPDIKEFAERKCIPTICDYFWTVPASSTGKYHPTYSLGDGGLMRHTIALVKLLNHMFGVESIANQFTSRERDLLRIAGIMHDTRKSGSQEDYEKSKWTKFDHPLQAASVIRGLDGLSKDERELIAHAIESHMGQWSTDKRYPDVELPKPRDKYQIILHLADYLASRKDIEIKFDNVNSSVKNETVDINNWIIPFGKHKGKTLVEVDKTDHQYILWAKENIKDGMMKRLIEEFL